MIRNQWYVVLESNEVRTRPIGITRLGENLVFWRDQAGVVSAAVDRCPHRGVALSVGKVLDGQLQCPFHGFEFDASGKCTLIPANGRNGVIPNALQLNTYPTYEAHGLIWLWWGTPAPKPAGIRLRPMRGSNEGARHARHVGRRPSRRILHHRPDRPRGPAGIRHGRFQGATSFQPGPGSKLVIFAPMAVEFLPRSFWKWRLSNKRAVAAQQDELITDITGAGDSIAKSGGTAGNKENNDLKNPETYTAQLPRTPEALAESNKAIAGALINLGYIYKDGLNDFPHSVEAFEDLARRFSDMKEIVRIYYQLYLIGKEIPDEALSEKYSKIILEKYNETDYAQLITNPDFNKELNAQKNRAATLYEETYQAYKRGQYKVVLLYCNQALSEYKDKDLIPRFEYLRAIALGKTVSTDTMVVALNKLVLRYATHPVTPLAKEMLVKYDKNSKAVAQNNTQANTNPGDSKNPNPASSQVNTGNNPFIQSSDTAVPDIYTVNLSQTHFYILMVDANKINVNATKIRITDFILKNFSNANLSVNAIVLDDGWQMISISSFRNSQSAMDFFLSIDNNEYVFCNNQ